MVKTGKILENTVLLKNKITLSLRPMHNIFKVRSLQVGTHYFPEVKVLYIGIFLQIGSLLIINLFQLVSNQNERYCKIRLKLSLTHKMVWGEPYAWERWDRLV